MEERRKFFISPRYIYGPFYFRLRGDEGLVRYWNGFKPTLFCGIPPIMKIAHGRNHRLMISKTGSLLGVGHNKYNQLGLDVDYYTDFPTTIPLYPVQTIACGNYHSAVVLKDGSLYTFGSNKYGQLGTKLSNVIAVVRGSKLSNVIEVACGSKHTLALTSEGNVYSWGRNNNGQLGLDHTNNITTPQQILSLSSIIDIGCGSKFSMAYSSSGVLYFWGENIHDRLGSTNYLTPEIIDLPNIKSISCGNHHSVVLMNDGSCLLWGNTLLDQQLIMPKIEDVICYNNGILYSTFDGKIYKGKWTYSGPYPWKGPYFSTHLRTKEIPDPFKIVIGPNVLRRLSVVALILTNFLPKETFLIDLILNCI